MSDNWIVGNLQNALNTWNGKLSEIWQLVSQTPETFKDGTIWRVIVNIHGALQAIGFALLVLFFVMGVVKTMGNFSEIKMSDIDKQDPQITEANVDNEKWEKQKSFKLKANDNIRIYGWNITKSDKVPSDWKKTETITNNIDVTEELNQNSLVFMLNYKGFRVLLTGDNEKDGEKTLTERYGSNLKADVLQTGHHGSKNATSKEFLDAVEPDIALISCGRNNRYGHPAGETLERLDKAGVDVFRTDRDGAILLEDENGKMILRTADDF